MASKDPEQPKQKTPKGKEIPVPKRKEVLDFFKGVTGKRTPVRPEKPQR